MTQEEKKQEVLKLIQSGCDYDQGVLLYSQFGKNSFMKTDFPKNQKRYKSGNPNAEGSFF